MMRSRRMRMPKRKNNSHNDMKNHLRTIPCGGFLCEELSRVPQLGGTARERPQQPVNQE